MANRMANPKCKTAGLPKVNVDLGGVVKVIDFDSADRPVWRIVATLKCASRVNAIRALRAAGETSGWLVDDCCCRELLSASDVNDPTVR
jgi:hypothetical protein